MDAAASEKRETPDYVLEDTLEMQALWHATAGTRPAQPAYERKRMEEIWAKQIAESQACKDFKESPQILSNEKDVKILARDASPVRYTSVTKSRGGTVVLRRAHVDHGEHSQIPNSTKR